MQPAGVPDIVPYPLLHLLLLPKELLLKKDHDQGNYVNFKKLQFFLGPLFLKEGVCWRHRKVLCHLQKELESDFFDFAPPPIFVVLKTFLQLSDEVEFHFSIIWNFKFFLQYNLDFLTTLLR